MRTQAATSIGFQKQIYGNLEIYKMVIFSLFEFKFRLETSC